MVREAWNGKVDEEVNQSDKEVKGENLSRFKVASHENLAGAKEFVQSDNGVEKTAIFDDSYDLRDDGGQHLT